MYKIIREMNVNNFDNEVDFDIYLTELKKALSEIEDNMFLISNEITYIKEAKKKFIKNNKVRKDN